MKDRVKEFFAGRSGLDALGRTLLFGGLLLALLALLPDRRLSGLMQALVWIASVLILLGVVRMLSRDTLRRAQENEAFLAFFRRLRHSFGAFLDRQRQRKDYRFFKCPSCGAYMRVPRGKGRIELLCRCGYRMFRSS